MSDINITTCKNCSNYDALEAVARWMRENYIERNYKRERQVAVESGRILKVSEVKRDDELTSCNATFKVEALNT